VLRGRYGAIDQAMQLQRKLDRETLLRRFDLDAEQVRDPREAIPQRRHVKVQRIGAMLTATARANIRSQGLEVSRLVLLVVFHYPAYGAVDKAAHIG
jgi:hypothetical protein